MATYEEFIDTIKKFIKETHNIDANILFSGWLALATEEQWKEYGPQPLTKELVLNLAEDMVARFRHVISFTDSEIL